ncbi:MULTISPECIES: hypothetical protein [Bacillus]|uniref:hypothetical protein n=1 Tax=Bacillus TaxID=1386 RepID=UPI0007761904|nr:MULTISPECIES: hypothetical protein [Bacillus]AMM97996.1 hypothetical protein UP12_11795 [Bacillus pumilus]MDH3152134.1 hypothetical protein [Bacillus pumilus]MED0866230.1 hypothetical protein [Bacillus safensis]OYN65392.1 hypothetical protein CFH85_12135 [Bacillus safensis]QRY37770.1 hypothetical protein JVX94_02050 [Bacillus sp. PDNC022]
MENLFITDPKEFKHYQSFINGIYNDSKTFPDQIFKTLPQYFLFEEFHWLLSDDSWEMLKNLAIYHKDEYILMAVLDNQKSIDNFYRDFGYYYWVKLPLNISSNNYLDILTDFPKNNVNDSIMNIASRVIWVSPSAKWMIYGERGYEIGVLGTSEIELKNNQIFKTWRTLDEVVLDWISVVFPNQKLPSNFKNELIQNYSNND